MENKNFLQKIEKIMQERFDIGKECPEFFNVTKKSKKCIFFILAKVLISNKKCLLGNL
jgi:hypothetical protein